MMPFSLIGLIRRLDCSLLSLLLIFAVLACGQPLSAAIHESVASHSTSLTEFDLWNGEITFKTHRYRSFHTEDDYDCIHRNSAVVPASYSAANAVASNQAEFSGHTLPASLARLYDHDYDDGSFCVFAECFLAPGRGIGAVDDVADDAVRALDVDTYGNLKSREVVGDMLEHHEMPSRAAVEEAMSQRLGRPLTGPESRALQASNPSVEIPRELHLLQDTTGGKNTMRQILYDAADLGQAQRNDLRRLIETGLDHGYSRSEMARVTREIRRMNRLRGIK